MTKHKKEEPQAHLIPDPVAPAPSEQPIGYIETNSDQEIIPIIKPIVIESVIIPDDVSKITRVTPVELQSSSQQDVENIVVNDIKVISPEVSTAKKYHAHVFIAGVDNTIHSNLRLFFQQLGMPVFDAHATRQQSENITEQFQRYGRNFDFAVVVLSADEVTCQKLQTMEQGMWVSRQETIFELGFLVGKLGKSKVAVFYDPNQPRFKRPTEYFDLLYTPFDEQGQWKARLLTQLKNASLIDQNAALVSS